MPALECTRTESTLAKGTVVLDECYVCMNIFGGPTAQQRDRSWERSSYLRSTDLSLFYKPYLIAQGGEADTLPLVR